MATRQPFRSSSSLILESFLSLSICFISAIFCLSSFTAGSAHDIVLYHLSAYFDGDFLCSLQIKSYTNGACLLCRFRDFCLLTFYDTNIWNRLVSLLLQ
ncbi:uncharacterized protein LOC127264767 isoform X4 [Andrographis paniculata]|uniref:uncharacterized protein LOC127264767 isoform X4 n=2 Tax=Andrographis paniculata TaxID=175694 RepID=UPI0021E84E3F|nr:uncharacterized protein LOC127264767 isoform X4 [Andrographis paniculata]